MIICTFICVVRILLFRRVFFCLFSSAVPERELKRTANSKTALIRLPTHVGCAFAIDREFFFEIGALDEGMDILGFDNMELAFRVGLLDFFHVRCLIL